MENEIERITKLEAAKRQLDVAIRLFFAREDSLAIHTLASAAHEILLAIARKRSPEKALNSILNPDNPRVVPEHRKEYADIMRAAQNFLKHGSRDPEQVFEFRHKPTAYHILDALMLVEAIEGVKERSPELIFFEMWFFRKYPDVLNEGPFKEMLAKNLTLDPNNLEAYGGAMEIWRKKNRISNGYAR